MKKTRSGPTTTISHAPSVNFTVAKIATTKADVIEASKLIAPLIRHLLPFVFNALTNIP